MSDLDEIYKRLARTWQQEELAARYRTATGGDVRVRRGRRDADRALPAVATALHQCHRALELDAAAHGYTTEESVPSICDVATGLLRSARLDQEPPSVV